MGLFGKSKKDYQADLSALEAELTSLKSKLTPEIEEYVVLQERVEQSKKDLLLLEAQKTQLTEEVSNLIIQVNEKKKEIGYLDEEALYAEFGLYKPVYNFANSEMYKDRLAAIRERQKQFIKTRSAVNFPSTFTLDGSATKGKALVNDNVKQILRSFNNECDVLIDKVRFNSVEATRTAITRSFNSLNKMNSRMAISITVPYMELKLQELNLSYEYALKKQEEKEAQREERERLREEAKLQKEIEEARKAVQKEQSHYQNALVKLQMQLDNDPTNPDLLSKKEELINQLEVIDKNLQDIDYREANKRAGYVYIISNVGSFGEDVYKIGMTRRLEPFDRIFELGDASVPFNFDVHAMIFSDDAPKLENALHQAFDKKKVNMVNLRREFFHVTLEEIEEVVRDNHDKTVEFEAHPEAQQFRESILLREALQ